MSTFEVYILDKKKEEKLSIDSLYIDDTLHTIKNKICIALNENGRSVAYEELYLFTKNEIFLNKKDLYLSLTDDNETISLETMNNFLINIDNIDVNKKDFYKYEDIIALPNFLYTNVPLGYTHKGKTEYRFCVNPFDCKNSIDNNYFMNDNSVFLNFSSAKIIYICLAENVIDNTKDTLTDYIIKTYYPLLVKNDLHNNSELQRNRQNLIQNNKKVLNKDLLILYDTVKLFYDVYDKTKYIDFDYKSRGIKSFSVRIKNTNDTIVSLTTIFKNIHSTKDIPFIKFNPGMKRDAIYRMYSDKISVSGKKIPYLLKSEILKLSKEIGKNECVSMVIKHDYQNELLVVLLNVFRNGDIIVDCDFQNIISCEINHTEKIENIMNECINPVISSINENLEVTGYKLNKFTNFKSKSIIIDKLQYNVSVRLNKNENIKKISKILSSMFSFKPSDISNDTSNMYFKRVENYREMDPKEEFIINKMKTIDNMNAIIDLFVKEFKVSQIDAVTQVMKIKEEKERDVISRKIVDNSGFPVSLNFNKHQKNLELYVKNINSFDYINLIDIYFHSILILTQKNDLDEISEVIADVDEISKKEINFKKIEEIAKPEAEILETKLKDNEDENEDEDDDMFDEFDMYDNEDDYDEEEEEIMGGEGEIFSENDDDNDVGGLKLNNPNPFQKRIQERDPKLILTEQVGKFNQYSRTCAWQQRIQPVVLDDDEKDKIDERDKRLNQKSYTTAIQYGSDSDKQYWYICPRYWSLKHNKSLSQTDVDKLLKKYPKAMIPKKENVVPKDSFIFEFNLPLRHEKEVNGKKQYKEHHPTLIWKKHPDNLGIPCCALKEYKEEKIQKNNDDKTDKINTYVVDANKYPIDINRMGFLPLVLEEFFITNSKLSLSNKPNIIKQNSPCFIRYGVEQNMNQSIIGCFADIYSFVHNKKKSKIPNIKQMRNTLIEAITIDNFIKYQNGSLVSIFRPSEIHVTNEQMEKIKKNKSMFYDKIDQESRREVTFLKETIACYFNFLKFLEDDNSIIDHKYMWSIFSEPNSKLIPNGLNMVILNMSDLENTLEILCPTNPYQTNIFDPNKDTWFLLKHDDYYEPIYLYEQKGDKPHFERLFSKLTSPITPVDKSLHFVFNQVYNKYEKFCRPKKSLPYNYNYDTPKSNVEIKKICDSNDIKVDKEVMNYQSKIVGLMIYIDGGSCFIPCLPSNTDDYNIVSIEDPTLWETFENTITRLSKVNINTKNKIKCLPIKMVSNDGNIIGVITQTNQYIRVSDNIQNDEALNIANKLNIPLEIDNSNDYLQADVDISILSEDKNRVKTIRKVILESQYYSMFRTTVRILLDEIENINVKRNIKKIVESSKNYEEKVKSIYNELLKLANSYIKFEKDYKGVKDLNTITTCFMNCENKPSCIKEGESCMLRIPHNNLHNNNLVNDILYYTRLADELVRFIHIRNYLLEDNYYLNMNSMKYKINKDEILIVDSFMKSDYFNELIVFDNKHSQNITFEIAQPEKSEKYINKDTL
jgi:hypothetical protein